MELLKALSEYPVVQIFRVLNDDHENQSNWDVEPIHSKILIENEGFFIIKAKNILLNKDIKDCYIDIVLPERISDYAYFFDGRSLKVDYHHEFEGDIICAVPIDCFGVYELFYSRIYPDIGINILKEGLPITQQKVYIAEDLGYILRDEGRFYESAEMFQISANESPSSYFIYGELENCYERIGNHEKAKYYKELFNKEGMRG